MFRKLIAHSPASAVNDTTPKAKANKKQIEDRTSDHFEITDKKAISTCAMEKRRNMILQILQQRQNFEYNYGKIISVAANADDLAPVSVVVEARKPSQLSHPSVEATMTTCDSNHCSCCNNYYK